MTSNEAWWLYGIQSEINVGKMIATINAPDPNHEMYVEYASVFLWL